MTGEPLMVRRTTPPFRADHVGSLLRTAPLKEARAKRERGEITAESEGPGRGSRFAVRLPLSAIADVATAPVAAPAENRARGAPRRVLVQERANELVELRRDV